MNGEINRSTYLALSKQLRRGAKSIIVTSPGGSVEFGQRSGQEIARRRIQVIVKGHCLSACANYIFLSAEKKSLLPGAVLGFHGGFAKPNSPTKFPQNSSKEATAVVQKMERLFEDDLKFFESIGVDASLIQRSYELTKPDRKTVTYVVTDKDNATTVFGENEEPAALKLMDDLIKQGKFLGFHISLKNISSSKFYFPSKEKLLEYGVRGISDYPYPSTQEELDMLAKSIDEEWEAIGDFPSATNSHESESLSKATP